MEKIYVHNPSQRVQKLRQSVTQSVPCIVEKLWCGSHIILPIWCSTFPNMVWGWKDFDISEILSYGTTSTNASVTPWGYGDRLGKVLATGENWWV